MALEMTALEEAFVNTTAASLVAEEAVHKARKWRKTAAEQLRDAAPDGQAPMTPDRYNELFDEAVRLSGLPEDSHAVQTMREAAELARQIKALLDNDAGPVGAAGFGGGFSL